MDRIEEVQIAFTIWEILQQLEVLLQERYFDEFNEIMYRIDNVVEEKLDKFSKPSE